MATAQGSASGTLLPAACTTPQPRLRGPQSRRLFRELWEIGLDRGQLSIHEMLTDILEVIEVARGLKPAHLAGQGEGAAWRIEAFARSAAAAGLHTLRTAALRAAPGCNGEAGDAAGRPLPGAARNIQGPAPPAAPRRVLWVYRAASLEASIHRLVAGERGLIASVLGYPGCCAAYDAQGEAALLRAPDPGGAANPGAAARAALEHVWRTRLAFPYLGFSACPHCLAQPRCSPGAHLHRRARALAFALDGHFARALWRTAQGEAALAVTGHFQGLNAAAADPCPCSSGRTYGQCCAGRAGAMPPFR